MNGCVRAHETLVNPSNDFQTNGVGISGVDFSQTSATRDQIDAANAAMTTGNILVAGMNRGIAGAVPALWATEFYVKSVAPGEIGAACGGIAGLTCKSGLSCVFENNYPDALGTCEPVANCMAMPGCDLGDVKSTTPCEADEGTSLRCYTRSMCGSTVICRKPT
jgi:hypothetical protein